MRRAIAPRAVKLKRPHADGAAVLVPRDANDAFGLPLRMISRCRPLRRMPFWRACGRDSGWRSMIRRGVLNRFLDRRHGACPVGFRQLRDAGALDMPIGVLPAIRHRIAEVLLVGVDLFAKLLPFTRRFVRHGARLGQPFWRLPIHEAEEGDHRRHQHFH